MLLSIDRYIGILLYLNKLMFPPLAKLRWANLPKIGKKFVFILLLLAVFFVSSPLVYVQAAPQVITPQKGADGQDYLLIPVSDLENYPSSNQSQSTRFATSSANPEGGQVLGVWSFFGDLFTAIGGGFEDLVGCLVKPAGCLIDGVKELFDFGMAAFQKFILNQVAGEAADCFIVAPDDPDRPAQCSEIDQAIKDQKAGRPITLNPAKFGILGMTAKTTTTALAMPLPFNSTTYLASINPFAKKAYATAGTDELEGSDIILNIWTKVRDGAYILLVVATVIVGFMIMLRIPTGPRTAVTVQNSLPKIAVAMLLITFSFLIAGLMLDATRIVGNLLQSFLPSVNILGTFVDAAAFLGLILIFLISIFTVLTVIFNVAAPIVMIAIILLIALAIFAIFLMITYKLVSRLVIFLLMVMFAPLFFLAGALPKGEGAIIFWFKRTAAALLAIPATGFVISLAIVIGSSGWTSGGLNLDFVVEGIPATGFNNLAVDIFGWAFAAPIIGLVLLSFAIKTPDIVDEMFGVKGFGTRASGLGTILGAPGKGVKAAGEGARTLSYTQQGREGIGRALQGTGWVKSSAPRIKQNVPGGVPVSTLAPSWKNTLQKAGAIHHPAGAPGPVTKEGVIESPQVEKVGGFAAAAARAVRKNVGPLFGKQPQDKITFKSAANVERERLNAIAASKRSGGPGAHESPDDEKNRPV